MENRVKTVSKEEILQARTADLWSYIVTNYDDLFKHEGNSLSLKSNPSLYIKKGVPGFHDFSTGEHGNSIDFLLLYLGYRSFQDAVRALSGEYTPRNSPEKTIPTRSPAKSFSLPPAADPPFSRVFAYLQSRSIPDSMIQDLIQNKLLYQDTPYGNAVFVTPGKDYCELRGTFTRTASPFHGCRKISANRFWYYKHGTTYPEIAYITEGAIDAISLFLLFEKAGLKIPSVFISIGGVSNQQTITRIKSRIPTVLAVDNDEAGEHCRQKNPDLPFIIPTNKDWNEDLQNKASSHLPIPTTYQFNFFCI